MKIMRRIRFFHALLAMTVLAAYFSAETGIIHAWLGYLVSALVAIRLIWALTGVPQLGLERFYPRFKDLHLRGFTRHPAISRTLLAGIGICIIGVTGTGVMMDEGRALQRLSVQAVTFSTGEDEDDLAGSDDDGEEGEIIEEAHELFGNLVVAFVVIHVLYLLAFKRPLAKFMLFANQSVV